MYKQEYILRNQLFIGLDSLFNTSVSVVIILVIGSTTMWKVAK